MTHKRGFTLIELLVVISIIGLLATIVLVSLGSARGKARDVRRLSDMRQIQMALEMYYGANNNQYPVSDYQGCGGWDTPGDGDFVSALTAGDFLNIDLKDPQLDGTCGNYRYYLYTAGSYDCDTNRGNYYVLGVVDMETSSNPYPGSPGWSCSGRNWQGEMEWVAGSFER
jgi:prepilin-type N-terminal cleavage/methylation domain-containing protein